VQIPKQGRSRADVFATLESYRAGDVPWRDGRTWAYIYDPGQAAEEVIKQAFTMYLTENGLDPTAGEREMGRRIPGRSARVRCAGQAPAGGSARRPHPRVARHARRADARHRRPGGVLAMAGVEGSHLPERMAEINEVLNALPVALRERLLVEYLNDLYRSRE
jgi:hypothetical protein